MVRVLGGCSAGAVWVDREFRHSPVEAQLTCVGEGGRLALHVMVTSPAATASHC